MMWARTESLVLTSPEGASRVMTRDTPSRSSLPLLPLPVPPHEPCEQGADEQGREDHHGPGAMLIELAALSGSNRSSCRETTTTATSNTARAKTVPTDTPKATSAHHCRLSYVSGSPMFIHGPGAFETEQAAPPPQGP
jgi:hypothetical protein